MENENKDVIKDVIKTTKYDFSLIYAKYPKKLGRKAAERHFNTSVKCDEDWEKICLALANFLDSKMAKGDLQFIPHASTWFNNWQDWVEYKEKGEDDGIPASLKHLRRNKQLSA
jgi:hypothetical protein